MADDKFEDTRSSMQKMINVFRYSDTRSRLRNRQFEEDIVQIINRKSINNFELFAYAFDYIYDNKLQNLDDFKLQMNIFQNKEKALPRIVKIYREIIDLDDRDKTIELAFRIYRQHLRMIDNYSEIYSGTNKKINEIKSLVFDEKFFSNEYKFTDVSFDIFLSHRYYLRFYNIIVFYILTVHFDLVVYVDWIFDYNVDRKKLSEETVKLLKYRMNQSKKLVFFNILNSNTTNWMAWEVGYFSCLKEESIGILDLDGYCTGNKNVEVLSSNDIIKYDDSKGLFLEKTDQSINDWVYDIN